MSATSQAVLGPAKFFRALTASAAAGSAPTVVTDGIPVPSNRKSLKVHVRATIAGTTPAFTFWIWGWALAAHNPEDHATAPNAAIADSEGWTIVAKLAEMTANTSDQLEGVTGYSRLYVEANAVSGTNPDADVDLGFS